MGRLVLVTPATTRLITLDQAKLHCRCQHDAENDLFTGWIKSAEAFAQSYTSRALLSSTWQWHGEEFPWSEDGDDAPIDLGISPVQSISSVSYFDTDGEEQELDEADYQLEIQDTIPKLWPGPDIIWPSTMDGKISAVTVEFIAGYDDAALVPAQFSQAMLLMIGEWYKNRETTEVPKAAIMLLDQVKSERYV